MSLLSYKINLVSFRTLKRGNIFHKLTIGKRFFLNHSILTALVLLLNTYHDNTENNTSNNIVGSVLHEFVFKFFKASFYCVFLISGIFPTLVHFIFESFTTRLWYFELFCSWIERWFINPTVFCGIQIGSTTSEL